ncbi:hypothetical protein LTR36_010274 [Oleoguttula mirabilis]|uniref:Major facilitator superfamily (MFS) profile domain-containing protein n=1 Tax=Oleoguttula mirabilis TaxID=1507867 RepID=A0AAV9J559_9PEZI|nr:hypothetical protein LTR36_010274 [Oleoguttula mirabilis]
MAFIKAKLGLGLHDSDSGESEPKSTQQQENTATTTAIDPKQWSNSVRKRALCCLGLFAVLEPFSSSMIAPALQLIAAEFHITSSVKRNLVLSSFVLPYAFGSLLVAPVSESVGRRPVLLASAVFFLAFTIACGFAQTSAQLIVFRVLSGFGGCVPLAIGAAVVGDLYGPHERGSAMAVYSGLQVAGPALGPIVGGWIAQSINSWRWTFYVCAMASAVVTTIGLVYLPETYAPKLNRQHKQPLSHCFHSLDRPFILLATQPIIQVLAAYAAIVFGVYYILLTTIVGVFETNYGQSTGIASLHYLALLLGFMVSVVGGGKAMDALYRRMTKDGQGPSPEARIPFLAASGTLLPAGLLLYGWTAQYRVFWFAPDIGLFLIGLGISAPRAAIQHYILDCYSSLGFAASALAAMNVARFLAGFGFPLFADVMFDALGLGWGSSLLALAAAVTGCLAVSLWKFGPQLRGMSSFADA